MEGSVSVITRLYDMTMKETTKQKTKQRQTRNWQKFYQKKKKENK